MTSQVHFILFHKSEHQNVSFANPDIPWGVKCPAEHRIHRDTLLRLSALRSHDKTVDVFNVSSKGAADPVFHCEIHSPTYTSASTQVAVTHCQGSTFLDQGNDWTYRTTQVINYFWRSRSLRQAGERAKQNPRTSRAFSVKTTKMSWH